MSSRIDNRHKFLQTLTEELDSQADRVRNLIGDRHWLSDGHHKEYLLTELLTRHLPAASLATRGFLISPTDSRSCSTEQDILVIDCLRESPIFNQGGLAITCPPNLLASLSVKTTYGSNTLTDAVTGLLSQGSALTSSPTQTMPWLGIYFFHPEPRIGPSLPALAVRTADIIKPLIATSADNFPLVNIELCIRACSDIFFRISFTPELITIRGYQTVRLATAFFLGRLVDHISRTRTQSPSAFGDFIDAESDPSVETYQLDISISGSVSASRVI